ncbi:MAG TPA: flagellar hook-associated protein FlgK, partial [Verrucomicrobiales bacterium]|nr:flagellar hook-associated protein FlgK [Verrucomicrobiales bacterium]
GLFGTLGLGARSLQTQQMGVEVAGHNLSNVNNPNYSRQRIEVETSLTVPTAIGPQGTGATVTSIKQLRDQILDDQVMSELSVSGSLDSQQRALEYAQANLGQQLDRSASGTDAASKATSLAGQFGLADGITKLFNSFAGVAAHPSDPTARTVLLENAKSLASNFNQTDTRLANLKNTLDQSLDADVSAANGLLKDIASLNDKISDIENRTNGPANDLRDQRQAKLEELSKLAKISVTRDANDVLSVSIGASTLVTGRTVLDTLQTYNAGGGQMLVRTTTGATPVALAAGSMEGTISTRDGALATLRTNIDSLAALVISQVNTIHSGGFSLTGTTGAPFFTGTGSANIALNSALNGNPQLVQASGVSGAVGDNTVALQLSQLATTPQAALGGQTFSQKFNGIVATLGQSLANVNGQGETQKVVQNMLLQQRDSLMGVSIDEEMTDMSKFQKAYAASARVITTVDDMLDIVLSMKR